MLKISFAAAPGQVPDAGDVAGPLSHADGATGIEQIKGMRTLQAIFISRQDQRGRQNTLAFGFVHVKEAEQHLDVGMFKVIGRVFHLALMVHVPVGYGIVPLKVVNIVHALQIHGNPLQAVRKFNGDGIEFDACCLLKVRELCDLHAVKPYFPPEARGPKGR